MSEIKEHMKIIGKDGTPVGTVDKVDGERIKLTKKDSPAGHQDHHHYIDRKLVGSVEGDVVKLSVNADAVPKTEEQTSKAGERAAEGLRQATAKDEAKKAPRAKAKKKNKKGDAHSRPGPASLEKRPPALNDGGLHAHEGYIRPRYLLGILQYFTRGFVTPFIGRSQCTQAARHPIASFRTDGAICVRA